jgi:predicted hotdog family 3-hydroxylacyl-ACP dehydratase
MENITLPILDRDFVGNLIPQKYPFVMVDKVLAFGENFITSGFTVEESNIFTVNSTFQEAGLIEHMAQSVALYTGYQFFLKKETAPTGYIGSIKSIEIFQLPKVNEDLITKVNILQEFAGITLVDISVLLNEVEIARGQMKTVLA